MASKDTLCLQKVHEEADKVWIAEVDIHFKATGGTTMNISPCQLTNSVLGSFPSAQQYDSGNPKVGGRLHQAKDGCNWSKQKYRHDF